MYKLYRCKAWGYRPIWIEEEVNIEDCKVCKEKEYCEFWLEKLIKRL